MALIELLARRRAAALAEAMRADPNVVALGEDLGRGGIFAQYRGLQQKFGPDRVIDTPISEATIMGAAVGMALAGLRPVVEMRVVDFALCAMDELVNQAAKNRYMFGGQGRVPLVVRMPIGLWTASAAQHSQSLEAWFAHIPGLVGRGAGRRRTTTTVCSRARSRRGDPVVYMEHKELWAVEGRRRARHERAARGRAAPARRRRRHDRELVERSEHVCRRRRASLAQGGIDADVIDLRTLWPWDRDMVLGRQRAPSAAGRARGGAGRRLRRRDRRSGGRGDSAAASRAWAHRAFRPAIRNRWRTSRASRWRVWSKRPRGCCARRCELNSPCAHFLLFAR